MTHNRPQVRIGISGWRYPSWRGDFYPRGLQQRRELEYASRQLTSIEINGSFYSMQRPTSYRTWHDQTPDDFVFAVKGTRFITHMKKLNDVRTPLANFFATGVLGLGDKLGPMLWQLPPNLGFDPERMATFFALLPRSTAAAAALAKEHDERVPDDRAMVDHLGDRPLRHALEVRHASFGSREAVECAREHDIAVVLADAPGKWPVIDEPTSDFRYARLHGADELYTSGYPPKALDQWADRVEGWLDAGHDTFVYFDNDAKVRAPFDAMGLIERLRAGGQLD